MDIWAISHLTLFELCRFKYCWTYVVIRIYLHRFWVCSPLIHTISILKWLYRTHTCNNVWGFHLSFIFNSRCGFLFLFSYIAVFVMFLFLLCCSWCVCVYVGTSVCTYKQIMLDIKSSEAFSCHQHQLASDCNHVRIWVKISQLSSVNLQNHENNKVLFKALYLEVVLLHRKR